MNFRMERAKYIPADVKPNVLYVSDDFGIAIHLCACGCGSKVKTPLGPTEWSVKETKDGPTVWPSIGSWQLPCRSHYVIKQGRIQWAPAWTPDQIQRGRLQEDKRRRIYLASLHQKPHLISGFIQFAKDAAGSVLRRFRK
jgi:hypothetical protein